MDSQTQRRLLIALAGILSIGLIMVALQLYFTPAIDHSTRPASVPADIALDEGQNPSQKSNPAPQNGAAPANLATKGGASNGIASGDDPATQRVQGDGGRLQAGGNPPARPRQPRNFYRADLKTTPGQNHKVAKGDGGITLAQAATANNPRRAGYFESDAIKLDFPANSVGPLWKGEMPPGTQITIDIAMSQDGQRWSEWEKLTLDVDAAGAINPTYPDGRPNPNYGFMPSGLVSYGLNTWNYTRYRIHLYSEVAESPSVEAIRLFYQDTTLGKGQMASPPSLH